MFCGVICLHANFYITKPIDLKGLLSVVKRMAMEVQELMNEEGLRRAARYAQ
jgi:hypothetical protein